MALFSKLARATGLTSTTVEQRKVSSTQSNSTAKPSARAGCDSGHRTKRTAQGFQRPRPVKAAALHKVKGAKVAKLSNINREKRSSFFSLDRFASFFNGNKATGSDDLDGDTLVNNDDAIETSRQGTGLTLVAVQDENGGKSFRDYRGLRRSEYEDPLLAEWTEVEIWLINKLRFRGREPVFDRSWHRDFWWFPRRLFTTDGDRVLIKNTNANICRAIRAYDGLLKCGALVRSQLISGAAPERPLFRAINEYYKWSLADGGNLANKAHIPVTAIACARTGEATENVVNRLTDQLNNLARQYRDKWRRPGYKESDFKQLYTHPMPTLVGIVIKYTVVCIITLDTSRPRKPIRTVHTADWKVEKQECWHSIAVALAFVKQRDYLMQLDAEGELGPEIIDESDPDA